jgi:arylsulfatase A-like enzyme
VFATLIGPAYFVHEVLLPLEITMRISTALYLLACVNVCVCQIARNSIADEVDRVEPPNFVFFIADDMQRYMFNCLPESTEPYLTPHLDRLVAEGTLLAGQYVSAPVCTPSRFSCLTGLFASRSTSRRLRATIERDGQSVVGWNTMIQPDQVTVASLLQEAGYRTGMVGKNHVIDVPGRQKIGYRKDPGDPAVAAQLAADQERICRAMRRGGFDYAAAIYHNNPDGNGPRALAVHNLDWITQAGLQFLEEAKEEPFFLYFASTVPHGPGSAERSWRADPRATAAGFLDQPSRVLPPRETIPQRLRQAGLRVDDRRANMLWLDDALGAVMEKLEDCGQLANTIVFFFNDHGQQAKGTLYQGGISNPSIVWRQGGFPCGPVSNVRVSNIDFAPTILDFAGVAIPPGQFDGRSFRPLLNGDSGPIHDSLYFEMGFTRAVVKGDWKYLALRYPQRANQMSAEERAQLLARFNARQREHDKRVITEDPTQPFSHISLIPGGAGAEAASTGRKPGYYDADQLYHLSRDPTEQRNLALDPQYARKLEEMKRELVKYLSDLPGGFAELKE